jgi:thiol-disulfide isomerase/thioredoxin
MDRLSLVAGGLALALVACDGGGEAPAKAAGGSRVDAVAAKTTKLDLDGFCDVHAAAGQAKTMAMPETAGTAPASSGGWRWINVWATWCRPCIEELPMLEGLRKRFGADHLPLELVFLSVDADVADIDAYRKAHPETPASLQIRDATQLGVWLQGIGLAEDSALPIHLFVDDANKIRCVRMGAVAEKDYETVRGLVRAG